jgi:hypothetical protein
MEINTYRCQIRMEAGKAHRGDHCSDVLRGPSKHSKLPLRSPFKGVLNGGHCCPQEIAVNSAYPNFCKGAENSSFALQYVFARINFRNVLYSAQLCVCVMRDNHVIEVGF